MTCIWLASVKDTASTPVRETNSNHNYAIYVCTYEHVQDCVGNLFTHCLMLSLNFWLQLPTRPIHKYKTDHLLQISWVSTIIWLTFSNCCYGNVLVWLHTCSYSAFNPLPCQYCNESVAFLNYRIALLHCSIDYNWCSLDCMY